MAFQGDHGMVTPSFMPWAGWAPCWSILAELQLLSLGDQEGTCPRPPCPPPVTLHALHGWVIPLALPQCVSGGSAGHKVRLAVV